MNSHRYILEPYKGVNSRHDCPGCGNRKTFALYIDTETGDRVGPDVGRCNRESNCGYHYTPKQYFQDHNISFETMPVTQVLKRKTVTKPQPQVKPVSFIPGEAFRQSLRSYEANYFVNYLLSLFNAETVNKLISRYYIGSSKHWPGATVFWQIDTLGKLRAGKIMLYNSATGKRVKEPYNYITWVHKALELPEFNLQQCLFGEHLLKDEPTKPVAIVESEKTAIIASVYLPQFIWLACGSVNNIRLERCTVLKERNVTLYPDIKCFDKWKDKADDVSKLLTVSVSELLERKATSQERQSGLDIADYLIRFPIESFSHYQGTGPIILNYNDIVRIPCETHTGREFEKIIIVWVKTRAGEDFDLFFDENGEPIQVNTMEDAVKSLAEYFEKKLTPILLEGVECWGSVPDWSVANTRSN